MPRDMFGSVTDPPVHFGAKSKYSVPIAFLVHVAVLLPLIIIPIMASDVLPDPPTMIGFVVAPPPPPDPPPPAHPPADRPPQPAANPDAAPTVAPSSIEPETPAQLEPFEHTGLDPGVIPGGGSVVTADPAPPPPAPAPQQPVQIGGKIRAPERVHYVSPEYPAVARAARVEGTVIIQATIDADGRVIEARILRREPLLDQAAVEAVRQWRYTPTTLNGVAVPVVMTVTVTFKLQ